MQKIKILLIGLSFFLSNVFLTGTLVYALNNGIEAFGVNGIAGEGAKITCSNSYPNTEIIFEVIKPNGETVTIPYKTDKNGNAELILYDYHTVLAGTYQVTSWVKNNEKNDSYNIFKIYPDKVSNNESEVNLDKQTAESDGNDEVILTVELRDKYGNLITDGDISVISSRSEDEITEIEQNTNETKSFSITSITPGISTYTVMELNTGTVLDQREKVVYFANEYNNNYFAYVSQDSGGETSETEEIRIEDFPESINLNENIDFTVTAYNQEGNIDANYLGTIKFETTDDNAIIPEDYTFTADDMGQHEFSASNPNYEFKFFTAGAQKLSISDSSDTNLKNEVEIEVKSASNSTTEEIVLESPIAGSYAKNVQTVKGSAAPGSTIIIYDNNKEIDKVETDMKGKFTFSTPPLIDGEHKIYVSAVDENNTVLGISDEIKITIDTEAPKIEQISLDPSGSVKPGESVSISLYSEENLSTASIVFNDELINLKKDEDIKDLYNAILVAPDAEGIYPINIILADELDNEQTFNGYKEIEVSKNGASESAEASPDKVTGLFAVSGDETVNLEWDESSDDTYIQNYRIYYGTSENNLTNFVNTYSSDTNWYIPNLENGTKYFFAVTAIDSSGNESSEKSLVVNATPGISADSQNNAQVDKGDISDVKETTKSGPEALTVLFATLIFSETYFRLKKYLKFK